MSGLLGPHVQSWTGRTGKGSPSSGAGPGGEGGAEGRQQGTPPPISGILAIFSANPAVTEFSEQGDWKLRKPAMALTQAPLVKRTVV